MEERASLGSTEQVKEEHPEMSRMLRIEKEMRAAGTI